ncbi:MAG: DUF1565 domain-containing protein [Sedimentisphaerales bacterium]|nr:DUF1565 domain-containing protein [Sedimentisphaerales bacterium]
MKTKVLSGCGCVSFLGLFLAICPALSARIIYVDAAAGGNGSGTDWTNACTTLTSAMALANYGDQIWTATGVYQENLAVENGVALYGGFSGTELHLQDRDPSVYQTTIDGNQAGPVVTIANSADSSTRLDGFIVTRGNGFHGGGIRIIASSPVIANNIITGNLTNGLGAGIYCYGFDPVSQEDPTIVGNIIVDNFAYDTGGNGGGIACHGSSPTILSNVIARNMANRNGGGISCWAAESDTLVLSSSPAIANNYILANAANLLSGSGGNNIGGGGIHCTATDLDGSPIQGAVCQARIINNVIAANGGWKGGGICAVDSILESVTIINNTLVANSGAGIFWQNTSPRISNNLIAYNTWGLEQVENLFTHPVIRYNCVYGNRIKGQQADYKGVPDLTAVDGNIRLEPKMAEYRFGDFHIQPDSPCLDAGDSDEIGYAWTDIDQQDRWQGNHVDIGADESDGTFRNIVPAIIHVKSDGNDDLDGLTWSTAKKTISAGIDAAASQYGEVWVAAGTYLETIRLPAFVYLYGGFAGSEEKKEQRDTQQNPTVIDALKKGCVVTATNAGYRVSRLDGFVVQGGSPLIQNLQLVQRGGGIWITCCGPTIADCLIRDNQADDPMWSGFLLDGGGLYTYLGYPMIMDNTFTGNKVNNYTVGQGGAICSIMSGPEIVGNTMTQNTSRVGTAVYAELSEPYLFANSITQNVGPFFYGASQGAITCYLCEDYVISHNIISENVAATGAGITSLSCFQGRIQNNLFLNNRAYEASTGMYGAGGGIYMIVPSAPQGMTCIVNNTFVGNMAGSFFEHQGGAVAVGLLSDALLVANNILAYNSSGIWQQLGSPGVPQLFNNCVFNQGTNYVRVAPGQGDISLEPGFVHKDLSNYRLSGLSPCIDRGKNESVPGDLVLDLNGFARFIDDLCTTDAGTGSSPLVDIGAYEYLRSDITSDGHVNLSDFARLASQWLRSDCEDCGGGDLTCDGQVDMEDAREFGTGWLQGGL